MIITTDTGTTETSINQIIQGGKYEFCIDSRDIAAECPASTILAGLTTIILAGFS